MRMQDEREVGGWMGWDGMGDVGVGVVADEHSVDEGVVLWWV